MTPAEIARACDGDEAQLDILVGLLLPAIRLEVTYGLRRRAAAHGRDAAQDVDDFVQDVMLHLLAGAGRKLRGWDPTKGRSLSSFVRLLTRHRVSQVLGGHRGNPWDGSVEAVDPTLDARTDDDGVFDRILSRQQLEHLMGRLRARFNERSLLLFELLYVEQRPVAEVCVAMSMTRAAVDQWNVRLRRLVRQLAAEIDREPDGGRAGRVAVSTEGAR